MADEEKDEALSLSDLIRDIGHGATERLGSAKLTELLNACRATGKKGVLTVQIGMAAGQDGIAEIAVAVKTSKPEAKLPGGSYFLNKDGGLVTEDPRQLKLPVTKLPDSKIVNINGGK